MIEPGTSPEQVLAKLGISEPGDLDIEAIAYYCGATILYESLTGCEAAILGNGKKRSSQSTKKAILDVDAFLPVMS